jgi:hypothetical protein
MPIATRSSSSSIESSENGEPAKHHASTAVVVANWLAFLCLGTATVTLLLQAIRYAGPVSTLIQPSTLSTAHTRLMLPVR